MKIEDIRDKQAAEAESRIQAQFKMERIVYCQDDLYIGDLNAVRAEMGPTVPSGKGLQFSAPKETSIAVEMLSHTTAYFSVSCQAVIQQICCPLNATAETPQPDLAGVITASVALCREQPGGLSVPHSGSCSASV